MTIEPDDPRLVFMPEADVLSAKSYCQTIRNSWFSVHPERGLMFWNPEKRRQGHLRGASPQCNSQEAIAEMLKNKLYPWAETKFYPLVLVPIDLKDYQ